MSDRDISVSAEAEDRSGSPRSTPARVIAFYLPQFHRTPENDRWWGEAFVEWTLVKQARPLFRGHEQPRVPSVQGCYDLLNPETRQQQAEMASAHGVEAFCYWHYWYAGQRLLHRPFDGVLTRGEPDFPFCLGWANHSWIDRWGTFRGRRAGWRALDRRLERLLIEQTYPGPWDHERHFYTLLDAFGDPRYVRVNDKPLFYILCPYEIPDPMRFTDLWRELAHREGLKGLYLVGNTTEDRIESLGLDAANPRVLPRAFRKAFQKTRGGRLLYRHRGFAFLAQRPAVCEYDDMVPHLATHSVDPRVHPMVIPNWDNTPRASVTGVVARGSTPEGFARQLRTTLAAVSSQEPGQRLVFLKSWNEWAEGNYVEPDRLHGFGTLRALRDELRRALLEDPSGPHS